MASLHHMTRSAYPIYRSCALFLAIVLTTAGCATHPNDIAAQDMSAAQYTNYSCLELANEYRRLNEAIASASGVFNQDRSRNAAEV